MWIIHNMGPLNCTARNDTIDHHRVVYLKMAERSIQVSPITLFQTGSGGDAGLKRREARMLTRPNPIFTPGPFTRGEPSMCNYPSWERARTIVTGGFQMLAGLLNETPGLQLKRRAKLCDPPRNQPCGNVTQDAQWAEGRSNGWNQKKKGHMSTY